MKVLIVKIAAIGDVVMSLPLLNHIRAQHPNAQVTWVAGKVVAPLIRATGLANVIEVDEQALYKGSLIKRLLALMKIWQLIGGRFYDLVITAHADFRYRLIAITTRSKEKRFWDRKGIRMAPVPGRYHANEYLRLFSALSGPDVSIPSFPKLAIPRSEWVEKLLETLSDKPLVVIAPGGAKNILVNDTLRRWPIESYASLMKSLSNFPVHLILTGAGSDEWIKEHLKGISYTDLIGKLSLLDLTDFLSCCQLLITHDSGPLHLAKVAECPAIALFGPTNPWEKIGRTEKIKVLWGGENLSCRPCYDGKTYASCKQNQCLKSISPHEVLKEALALLKLPHNSAKSLDVSKPFIYDNGTLK